MYLELLIYLQYNLYMSNEATSAVNQQETHLLCNEKEGGDPQRLYAKLLSNFSEDELKAYLLGAIHDATLSTKHHVRFSQKGRGWLLILQPILEALGYNSWIYKEGKDRNVYVLETTADFLVFDFDPCELSTAAEKKSYIRGFFDAEGGIP